MAEQFLYGSDVVAGLEQVGGEGVAESVARDAPRDSCGPGGAADGSLHAAGVQMKAPTHLSIWIRSGRRATKASMAVEVLDDSTYTLRLDGQSSGTPLDDYLVYYPKHLLERLDPNDFYEWDFWTRPIGNGPYRFVNSIPKTMMELEANPDYFRGQPPIERVVLKFGESNLTELFSGNVDVLTYFNQLDIPKLVGDERYTVYYQANLYRTKAILWNHTNGLFSDAGIRTALTMAIDRREL